MIIIIISVIQSNFNCLSLIIAQMAACTQLPHLKINATIPPIDILTTPGRDREREQLVGWPTNRSFSNTSLYDLLHICKTATNNINNIRNTFLAQRAKIPRRYNAKYEFIYVCVLTFAHRLMSIYVYVLYYAHFYIYTAIFVILT